MGRSAAQRAANESRFREANEKLERKVVALSITEWRTPYFCECDDPHCTSVVTLTIPEYEAVRSRSTQFAVMPDHHSPPNRVLEEHDSFTLIEKTGEEAQLVEEQDPRSSSK